MTRVRLVPLIATITAVVVVAAPTVASGAASGSAVTGGFVATRAPGVQGSPDGLSLQAVSCASPGNCVAVGQQNGSGAIDVETAGRWSAVEPASITGAATNALTAVSCPKPGACVAVGTGSGPNGSEAVALVQSGSRWTGVLITGPGGLYSGFYLGALSSVACPAAGSCVAVGYGIHDNAQGVQETDGLIAELTPNTTAGKPGVWSVQRAPEYLNAQNGSSLSGVSCSAPGLCRAVGSGVSYDPDTHEQESYALIDDEQKYVWGYGAAANPSDEIGGHAGLVSISCIGTTFVCMAAGHYATKNQSGVPMIQTTDSHDHSEATGDLLAANKQNATLVATSCASNGFCQSVGSAYHPGDDTYGYGYDGYIVSFKYGAPAGQSAGVLASDTRSPADANSVEHNETLTATSCTTNGVCVSVGNYLTGYGNGNEEAGVIDTRTYDLHGSIVGETDVRAPMPADAALSDSLETVNGVSCNDSSHCVAVGFYELPTGITHSALETLGSSPAPPPAPRVTKVAPASGPLKAGTRVTVTGTNLTHVTTVRFGAVAGTKLTVVSSSRLTVTAPTEKAGRVDVRVTTAGGTSAVTTADRFTFVALPSLSRLSPARGSHAGGTRVTITGINLSGASRVVFGSTAASHLTRVSSRTLVVTAPAHARGTVPVRVTTAGGTSVARRTVEYTYH